MPMSGSTVLCLGEVLVDCLADQPTLLAHEVKSWTSYPGGAPANVACALQKLGTHSAFIGCVGEDGVGFDLSQLLQTVGVNTAGIQHHSIAPTRQVYVLRDSTGDRQFSGFSHPDPTVFADAHLRADQLLRSLFESGEYLILGTLGLAYPETRGAIAQAITWANELFLKVIVDVNWRPRFWPQPHQAPALILHLLSQVDILKLSQEEAEWLFNTDDPQVIAAQLPDLEGVLLTHGAQGCRYVFHGHVGEIPAFPVQKTIDTTGAGDSFLAGFIHQLRQQGIARLQDPSAIAQMVRYASAVGALTTLHPGAITAQPTPEMVEVFLAAHADRG